MIDWEKTELETGYGKEYFDRFPKSNYKRKVWKICDQCGKGSLVKYLSKDKLCRSCAQKNRPSMSDETKDKISKNHARLSGELNPMYGMTGNKNPMWGKKHSEKTKKLISDNHADVSGKNNPMFGVKGEDAPCYGRTGELHPMFGTHHSDEAIAKISKHSQGENHPMWGKHQSEKSRIQSSCSHRNIQIEDFDGFYKNKVRDYVLTENECIKLNKRFNNSHFHHITKSLGIFIPKELHYHINHNMKSGEGMAEMNMLSLQFINGEL